MRMGTVIYFGVLLIMNVCYGDTDNFDKHVKVSPTNANLHGIKLRYHVGAMLLTVEMPSTSDNSPYDEVVLEFADMSHDLKAPIAAKLNDERLVVAFWANYNLLKRATLKFRFCAKNEVEGLVFVGCDLCEAMISRGFWPSICCLLAGVGN